MKKLISVLSLVLATTTAQASTSNVKFVAQDASIETNLCVIAAERGYYAAKTEAKKSISAAQNFSRMTCNGQDVKSFAKSFNVVADTPAKQIILVPVNDSQETQLCLKAANNGIRSIGNAVDRLNCNGKSVSRFVKFATNS